MELVCFQLDHQNLNLKLRWKSQTWDCFQFLMKLKIKIICLSVQTLLFAPNSVILASSDGILLNSCHRGIGKFPDRSSEFKSEASMEFSNLGLFPISHEIKIKIICLSVQTLLFAPNSVNLASSDGILLGNPLASSGGILIENSTPNSEWN